MSVESDLDTLLKAICPRSYAVRVKSVPAKPYLIWQQLGGDSIMFTDHTPADKRSVLMQVTAWGESYLSVIGLIRQVEDAMCASSAFLATPTGEPLTTHEPDTDLFGAIQRFNIFAAR